MGTFFDLNWLIIVVTALILVGGYFAQSKKEFVSKTLKIEPKSFYIIIGGLGLILAIVNYLAVTVFGFWKAMFITAGIVAVVVIGLLYYFKNKKK